MRLIDADALTRRFKVRGCFSKEFLGCMIAKVIDAAPTIDAVPVVRCGECDYYEGGECVCPYIFMSDAAHMYPQPDDFCSYGERKDGAEDG